MVFAGMSGDGLVLKERRRLGRMADTALDKVVVCG